RFVADSALEGGRWIRTISSAKGPSAFANFPGAAHFGCSGYRGLAYTSRRGGRHGSAFLLLPANTPARPGRYSRGGGTRRRNRPAQDAADDRPHRQSPSCGKRAAYDKSLRVERHDVTPTLDLRKSPKPADGLFHLPTGPGLGLQINEAELAKRRSRNYSAPE